MRTYFSVTICLFMFSASGQDQPACTQEIGISPFVLEANSETINQQVEPKFLTGLYYQYQLSKRWRWNSQLEYGENSLKDNSNCADCIYGKGQYSEFNIISGFRFRLNANKSEGLSWFLGNDLYLSWLNYSGYFEGGWGGGIHLRNKSYYVFGGQLGAGVKIRIFSKIVLSGYSSIRLGYGLQRNNIIYSSSKYSNSAGTLLKISIGYQF